MQIAQNVCWHKKVSFVSYEDTGVYIITKIICTVKLRYDVLLGTGKNSTLYPRYVVTIKATNTHL